MTAGHTANTFPPGATRARFAPAIDTSLNSDLNTHPLKTLTKQSALRISYGANRAFVDSGGGNLQIGLPIPFLGEIADEQLPFSLGSARETAHGAVIENDDEFAVFLAIPMGGDPVLAARKIYREIFSHCKNRYLYRIWNYVPGINSVEGTLETYRKFNKGRWGAFEEKFGMSHQSSMPAASAVGAGGDQLIVLAIGGTEKPVYLENPHQVPAYNYPVEHGPRAPGFARGTLVAQRGSQSVGFLSGTASIAGHRSIGAGDLKLQFETTASNVATMQKRMGLTGCETQLKCYLRNPDDLERAVGFFRDQPHLGRVEDSLFLKADICRIELDIEIEAIYTNPFNKSQN